MTVGGGFDHLAQEQDDESLGPGFDHTATSQPAATSGGGHDHTATQVPGETSGGGFDHVATGIPTETLGGGHDHVATGIPLETLGGGHDHTASAVPGDTLGGGHDHVASSIETPPVIENAEAVQRDVASTFLVDVTFGLYHPLGNATSLTFEWAKGSAAGPFQAANPQALDSRHNATSPQVGLPTTSPGREIDFAWNAFFDLPEGTHDDVFVRITAEGSPQTQVVVGPIVVVTTVSTQPATNQAAQLRRNIASRTAGDFLGCGLVIPFRRASRDFANNCDVELIRACVQQILGTRASVGEFMGELKWRPDFGNKLWVLRHRAIDETLEGQAEVFVQEALRWEPRVQVTKVTVESEPHAAPNELRVRVRYKVITENVDDNRVILPEFEEVVPLAA